MAKIQMLKNRLESEGYKRIETNLPQFTLYFRAEQEMVRGIFLAEFSEGQDVRPEQMVHIHSQVYRILTNFGKDPQFLTLIAGTDAGRYRDIAAQLPCCWLWDTEKAAVMIYEKQPARFMGLEGILEDINCGQNGQAKGKSTGLNRMREYYANRPKAVVNTSMVAINVIVFIVMELIGSTEDINFMLESGAAYAPWILEYGEYYRLFTCMFLHFGMSHLVNNMLVLFMLGDNVERAVGRWKYLVIYIFSGLSGSLFSFAGSLFSRSFAVSAGASGAIFGIIGALFYIVAVNKGRLEDMTTRRLGIMIVFSLYHGFTSAGVDNLAHVGGMIGGILMAMLLYRRKKRSE